MVGLVEFEVSCGICDSYVHAEVESVAQMEFLNSMFNTSHQHTTDDLHRHIMAGANTVLIDGEPDGDGEDDDG